MKIGGYQKNSLIDFPGKVAAVVFTQGCGWRCPYCHNRSLVLPARFQPAIPEEEIFDHLKLRQGQLDGVVITGGEPTQQPDLADFCRRVRKLGFLLKLDTNGSQPGVLSQLIGEGLVDYFAMDVKGPFCDYARFTGCAVDTGPLELSMELIKKSGVPYEFRTTLVGGLHTAQHLRQLAPQLIGVRRYAIQSYHPLPPDAKTTDPFSPPDAELLATASKLLRSGAGDFLMR